MKVVEIVVSFPFLSMQFEFFFSPFQFSISWPRKKERKKEKEREKERRKKEGEKERKKKMEKAREKEKTGGSFEQ